jgi:hypothetical protein
LPRQVPVATQQATLTPQDYLDIQQLVSKYAYAIDECTNKDTTTPISTRQDGAFLTSRNGKILNRFEGRERLAEAARGRYARLQGRSLGGHRAHAGESRHRAGAGQGQPARCTSSQSVVDGEPGKVEAQGRYEDVYVKTANGWRFKSRTHVLAAGQQEVSRGSKPNPSK